MAGGETISVQADVGDRTTEGPLVKAVRKAYYGGSFSVQQRAECLYN
jgi:hypothetical protein